MTRAEYKELAELAIKAFGTSYACGFATAQLKNDGDIERDGNAKRAFWAKLAEHIDYGISRDELVEDIYDALSNAQDMDTTLTDLAKAVVRNVPAIAALTSAKAKE